MKSQKLNLILIIASILTITLFMFFTSCEKETEEVTNNSIQEIDMNDFYVYTDNSSESKVNFKKCFTMEQLNKQLDTRPDLYGKMYNVEKHTREFIVGRKYDSGNSFAKSTQYTEVTINVVVNILEANVGDVTQAQIDSQIAVLNEDFNNKNPNTNSVPDEFSELVTNTKISFILAGINRKISSVSNWSPYDEMKHENQGGIDVTDPEKNLNIWVVSQITYIVNRIEYEILGYAQFPGGSLDTDGIVLGQDYFGNERTATHEIGHYLNLRHIWGDGRCNRDDFVNDTPKSDNYNLGCPVYPVVNCRTNDMTMNYMDYTDDNCMYMFTHGQNDRMRALFDVGGIREDLVN